MVVSVGLSAGRGVAGHSDYNVGDKDAIVPEPLPSKTSRRRRRRFKKHRDMDERGEGVDKQPPAQTETRPQA